MCNLSTVSILRWNLVMLLSTLFWFSCSTSDNNEESNGKEGDDFGCAGYCVPPMYRDGLAFAMEKMCESRRRRIRMGKSGQARTKAYYRHERMISEYRKLYREVEEAYGRDWI